MVDRRVPTLARALGAATTRRRLFALALAAGATRSLTALVAAQATPTADEPEPGWEAGVAGLASRTFAAPDPDAPGLVSLSAVALAYNAPEEAAAAFPFMFDVFAFGMLDADLERADVPAPAIGDEALVRTLRADDETLAAVGYRTGEICVVVLTRAVGGAGDALAAAVDTAERAWQRATQDAATPTPAADGWGPFAAMPGEADVPPGLAPEDEDVTWLDAA